MTPVRVTFINIGGYDYPLVNSLYVAEQIENMDTNSVSSLAKMLEAMTYAGAKYLNLVGSPNKNLKRFEDGSIAWLSAEEISILIGIDESAVKEISSKISECFAISQQKQVTATSKKKKKRH